MQLLVSTGDLPFASGSAGPGAHNAAPRASSNQVRRKHMKRLRRRRRALIRKRSARRERGRRRVLTRPSGSLRSSTGFSARHGACRSWLVVALRHTDAPRHPRTHARTHIDKHTSKFCHIPPQIPPARHAFRHRHFARSIPVANPLKHQSEHAMPACSGRNEFVIRWERLAWN